MPDAARRFARRVFTGAAIYGLVALLPQYFLEARIGRDFPPAITHPEHFYGFVGLALAWQLAFLVIARDPVRYRALMPVAMLEKLAFGGAAVVLFALHRTPWPVLAVGAVDLVLAALFLMAYRATPHAGGRLP
jgi:hypothetical protein